MLIHYLSFLTITSFCLHVMAHIEKKPPHIIFILADDMGFNDVSFHGSPQIPTPNLDALAANGIILDRYYAAPQCTPSRAALMTGRYITRTGLQHFVIRSGECTALPIKMKTMARHLKKCNYSTHMIGKWHLGFYKTKYLPTSRGFDSFLGYWNGQMDYYDHTNYEPANISGLNAMWGYDLHNNTDLAKHVRGKFSMDLFTKQAVKIINQHDGSQPLFLYFSSQACHVGNSYMRGQAPPDRVARNDNIQNMDRRTFAGLVSTLDDAVGEIFAALYAKGMLQNSVIAFASDNGGEVAGENGGHASNWPLRSMKFYTFEGGVRVPALLWSPLLNLTKPRVSKQLMHVSDWLPTFYRLAGGNLKDLGNIDGLNMWKALKKNHHSPRHEIMLQIDPFYGMSALIQNEYKLVNGTYPEGKNYWYGPSGFGEVDYTSMDEWVWRNGSVVKSIMEKSGMWMLKSQDTWREDAIVKCGTEGPPNGDGGCDPMRSPCLFNIYKDPCEYHNIADDHPDIVQRMLSRIEWFNKTGYDSISTSIDSRADPRCFGFAYAPWLDEDKKSDCPWLED